MSNYADNGPEDEIEVLEQVEFSDSEEEDGDYKSVRLSDSEEDSDEDLVAALKSLQKTKRGSPSTGVNLEAEPRDVTEVRPSVIDDFLRNFLIKVGMERTLDCFNTEWYELQSKGKLGEEYTNPVPDIYLRNMELDEQVVTMRKELESLRSIAEKARGTWDNFRKQRDFHRMHHKRVVQEKDKLTNDLKHLHKHYLSYEPALKELQAKYQVAMKEKMLMRLERDRMRARVEEVEIKIKQLLDSQQSKTPSIKGATKGPRKGADSKLPPDASAVNPYADLEFDAPRVESFQLKKAFKAHLNSVSAIAFHPRKPVIATVSDDETWKIWSVPAGDAVMSGEGHKDWVSGVDFHPSGTHLATSSGDSTVKLWDFSKANCSHTFTDHTQSVWGVAFHHTGDFLASCGMDHTCRLWDTNSLRCRQTFRGHVDSVNSVCWQPFTNNVCTGSGDKTVSLWDARSGLCVQTFYGHMNACNYVCMNLKGDTIASCDADGVIKLWDVRMVAELGSMAAGNHPINMVDFDRSGTRLAAACDDGIVRVFDTNEKTCVSELRGHENAVQAVKFDPEDKRLVSASSDCTFRIWS
jgi:WD40 repeat protein